MGKSIAGLLAAVLFGRGIVGLWTGFIVSLVLFTLACKATYDPDLAGQAGIICFVFFITPTFIGLCYFGYKIFKRFRGRSKS
jgi:hypothetical protein